MSIFSQRLRELRLDKGLSMKQLAKELNTIKNLNIQVEDKLIFNSELIAVENLDITANSTVDFKDDSEITGSAEITNKALLKTADGKAFVFGNSFVQNGEGDSMIGGTFKSFGASSTANFATDLYIFGSDTNPTEFTAGPNGSITVEKDLMIAADSSRPVAVNSNTNTSVNATNIVLYSGDLTVSNKVNTKDDEGDLILLGPSYSTKDPETQIATEFAYNQLRPSDYKYTPFATRTTFPDSSAMPVAPGFGGKISFTSGATLHSGQNFYANGIVLTGANWNLDIKQNSDSTICFAEAYNSTIDHSTVRCWQNSSADGSKAQVAAEDCTDAGNNKNWDFDEFEIVQVFTVRDNVVRVELNNPVRNLRGEINGRSSIADIETVAPVFGQMMDQFTYEAETRKDSYIKIYADVDLTCEITGDIAEKQITTDSEGNPVELMTSYDNSGKTVYFFYMEAPSSWNTDATGSYAGQDSSTDRNGNHRANAKPYIDVPRASAAKGNYIITDIWGKRLRHYNNSGDAGDDYKVFTDVYDSTGPVLISVKTGQEKHNNWNSVAASQKKYDSHNFIEFRYSEFVNFGTIGETSADKIWIPADETERAAKAGNFENGNENVKVTDKFGALQNDDISLEGTLSFAGLGTIEKGLIYTGTQGSKDKYVNSLYRPDKYSLRLSIAGYVNEIKTDSGITFNNWEGYIEKAELPSGKVEMLQKPADLIDETVNFRVIHTNPLVTDCAVKLDGTTPLYNKQELYNIGQRQLSVDSSSTQLKYGATTYSGIYGEWDIYEPEIAPFHRAGLLDAERYYETLGTNGYESSSVLDAVEFHVLDNKSGSAITATGKEAWWITGKGWCYFDSAISSHELLSDDSYCADNNFGGSRPFNTTAGGAPSSDRTSGGLRYCTYYNQATKFSYGLGNTSDVVADKPFANRNILSGGTAPIFVGSSDVRNPIPETLDNVYIKVPLPVRNLAFDTTFKLAYDDTTSYITDLAGNRLRAIESGSGGSIDQTPPDFDFIVAPVGKDEMYIVFAKQLTKQIMYGDGATHTSLGPIPESFEEIIPYCFDIGKITGGVYAANNTAESLRIKVDSPAQWLDERSNSDYTGIKLKLTRNVTLEDVENLYIRLTYANNNDDGQSFGKYNQKSYDPFTNVGGQLVTFIQDYSNIYMQMYKTHSISDFAVNVVLPDYAYDPTMINNDDPDAFIMNGVYEDGSWAVHDWNEEQVNFGSLEHGKPVVIVSNITDGTEENANLPVEVKMFISDNPDPDSVSTRYNKDVNASARVWLPSPKELAKLAPVTNGNFKTLMGDWKADKKDGIIFNITDSSIYNSWASGNQVSYLFGLMKDSDNPVTIVHTPFLNVDTLTYTMDDTAPLYALRLKDNKDITSFDLWSFKVKTVPLQRGGVTILNNVINPLNGEKTVIKMDTKTEGKVNIMVMTLDGSVITYLNKGTLKAGETYFTWDGKNNAGSICARGMYFIRIMGNGIDETRKVMIVK